MENLQKLKKEDTKIYWDCVCSPFILFIEHNKKEVGVIDDYKLVSRAYEKNERTIARKLKDG